MSRDEIVGQRDKESFFLLQTQNYFLDCIDTASTFLQFVKLVAVKGVVCLLRCGIRRIEADGYRSNPFPNDEERSREEVYCTKEQVA